MATAEQLNEYLNSKDYFHFLWQMTKELKKEFDAVEFGTKERDDRGMIVSRYASMLEQYKEKSDE
jgi:hypothetical protein